MTTLGECVTLLSGGTPSKSNPSYWDGEIPWVSCKDMKVDRLHDAEDHITELGAKNGTRLVDRGTILIVVRGMILAKLFPVAIAQRRLAFNQDLKALVCRNGVVSEYLYYWLKAHQHEIVGMADEAAHGTKRLQTDRLLALDVDLPQEDHQRRVAAILSGYDDLIENNTRRIQILEEMARLIYEEWFVRFRFPGHENVGMVESELGPIPEGWNSKSLKDVCCLVQYGYTASAKHEPTNSKFLRITDIVPPSIDWDTVPYCDVSEKVFEKYELVAGDIVIARTGATTGFAKRINKFHPAAIFASYLVRVRANADISNYLGHCR
jgi:type I restriction enzyme, S subunit